MKNHARPVTCVCRKWIEENERTEDKIERVAREKKRNSRIRIQVDNPNCRESKKERNEGDLQKVNHNFGKIMKKINPDNFAVQDILPQAHHRSTLADHGPPDH
jgi:hypothetical protein